MEKILLDTDIGGDIDDAICLAYLLKEPNCELLGITTVCGDAEVRASVADAICKAAGKAVPIVAGYDLVVITAAHTNFDYDMIQQNAKAIFDTRNAMKEVKNREDLYYKSSLL